MEHEIWNTVTGYIKILAFIKFYANFTNRIWFRHAFWETCNNHDYTIITIDRCIYLKLKSTEAGGFLLFKFNNSSGMDPCGKGELSNTFWKGHAMSNRYHWE